MSLKFQELSKSNLERCELIYHPLMDYSLTDWACCVSGEWGEACNMIKKLRRGQTIPIEEIGKEIADTVIYIDLLAQRLGLDLGEESRKKFKKVSVREGSEITL